MKKMVAFLLCVLLLPSLMEAKPWYKDKKFWTFAAGSLASSLLATKGIADCRREFGPQNCAGGAGPNFTARESLRFGTTFAANVLAWKLHKDHENSKPTPFSGAWFLPQIGAAAWNTTTFMRNDPDVAMWKKGIDSNQIKDLQFHPKHP